jgi:hypothetical protein
LALSNIYYKELNYGYDVLISAFLIGFTVRLKKKKKA